MIMPSNLEKCTSEKLSDEAVETLVDEAATHDASASAEVVVGPKICLYGVETARSTCQRGCCRPCRI
jgi:hypothetical protein